MPCVYPEGSYCDTRDRRVVEDPDSYSEMARDMELHRREIRDRESPGRIKAIMALESAGHKVERLSEHHFRVDGVLNMWPATLRYILHGRIRNARGIRGRYQDPASLLAKLGKLA